MGGGDLNAKKAWHPNTMKNQERVWKAEQAAAEEKKKIMELQRERALERDREELNKLARDTLGSTNTTNDGQLHWMYDKPDKKVQDEDYLLGKPIDKSYEQASKPEQNEIPAVSRRVVGSSMLSVPCDVQVDLARKLREDPLLLVKERERAARAALLNNPVQRSRLTELLRKEQEQKKAKSEKKSKKKGKDLDNILAEKLNALGGKKGVDLEKLLADDDSSSDDSSTKAKKKKKKKNKDKKKRRDKEKYDSETSSGRKKKKTKKSYKSEKEKYLDEKKYSDSESEDRSKSRSKSGTKKSGLLNKHKSYGSDVDSQDYPRKKRKVSPDGSLDKEHYTDFKNDRKRLDPHEYRYKEYGHSSRARDNNDKRNERKGLSEKEKAEKLAEMVSAGMEREIERSQRVAKQLSEIAADEQASKLPRSSGRSEAKALPDSLENRIRSNRHYIQRDHRHMNEHFARR